MIERTNSHRLLLELTQIVTTTTTADVTPTGDEDHRLAIKWAPLEVQRILTEQTVKGLGLTTTTRTEAEEGVAAVEVTTLLRVAAEVAEGSRIVGRTEVVVGAEGAPEVVIKAEVNGTTLAVVETAHLLETIIPMAMTVKVGPASVLEMILLITTMEVTRRNGMIVVLVVEATMEAEEAEAAEGAVVATMEVEESTELSMDAAVLNLVAVEVAMIMEAAAAEEAEEVTTVAEEDKIMAAKEVAVVEETTEDTSPRFIINRSNILTTSSHISHISSNSMEQAALAVVVISLTKEAPQVDGAAAEEDGAFRFVVGVVVGIEAAGIVEDVAVTEAEVALAVEVDTSFPNTLRNNHQCDEAISE